MAYVVGTNAGVVRALYGATDVDVAIGLMDDDCDWVESQVEGMPFVGTLHGTQTVRKEIYDRVSQFFSSFNLVPEVIFEPNGDSVVATGRVHAITNAGKHLDAAFVHVFDLDHGKIRRCLNYHDSGVWLAALRD